MTKFTPLEQQLNQLIQAGYDRFSPGLRRPGQTVAACASWLEAWELVKQMTPPDMRTVEAFEAAHPHFQPPIGNWLSDLEMELHNAGLDERNVEVFPDSGFSVLTNVKLWVNMQVQ